MINGQTFVNNASFGAYAEIVQSPAYRDDARIRPCRRGCPGMIS